MSELRNFLEERINSPQGFTKEKGFFYNGFQDFVLQEGKEFSSTSLTKEELKHFNTVFKTSKSNKLGECYYNAQVLTMYDDENRIEYWEGYTINSGFPILHGFNVLNGKVIDVTLKFKKKPILGVFDDREYMGVQFPKQWMNDRIAQGKNSTSFIDNMLDGYPVLREKWKGF